MNQLGLWLAVVGGLTLLLRLGAGAMADRDYLPSQPVVPIGIAAVFYAILAAERTGAEIVWVACSLVAAGSVLVHGMAAVPATHWYGRLDDDGTGGVEGTGGDGGTGTDAE